MYWFLSADGSVLYVGKAKDLKKRIAQYRQFSRLSPDKQQLVSTAASVQCEVRASELEALFVEAELVHRYQPKFNILLKDDKSPIYVVITRQKYPQVLMARRREIEKGAVEGDVFGPFPSAYLIKHVLRSLRPIFQWCSVAGRREKAGGLERVLGRPCFFFHLEQCSGACVGQTDSGAYRADITRLKAFLRGKTTSIQRQLQLEIRELSQQQRFEEAQRLSEQWAAIAKVTSPEYKMDPDIALPRLRTAFGQEAMKRLAAAVREHIQVPEDWRPERIEGFDVSNFQGKMAAVSMVVFEDGVIATDQYRTFHIKNTDTPNDYGMLRQVLSRRQNHPEWRRPDLILIDGGRGQLNAVKDVWQWPAPVVSLVKHPDRLVLSTPEGFVFIPADDLGPAGQLLQNVRDESHRFAKKTAHKRLAKRDFSV